MLLYWLYCAFVQGFCARNVSVENYRRLSIKCDSSTCLSLLNARTYPAWILLALLFPCFWNCLCIYVSASEVAHCSWYIQALGSKPVAAAPGVRWLPLEFIYRGSEFWLTQAEWADLVWAPHTRSCPAFEWPVEAARPIPCVLEFLWDAGWPVLSQPKCVCAGALEKRLSFLWFELCEREVWEFGHSDKDESCSGFSGFPSINNLGQFYHRFVSVTPLWLTLKMI